MNRDYALKNEEKDYLLMERFNEVLKLRDLGRTESKHHSDATGYTTDGRFINIELKSRHLNLLDDWTLSGANHTEKAYTANTLYIESHKMADLLLDYVIDNKIPLYINFVNDDIVIVHNLSLLKQRPKTVTKRISSKLYQGFEMGKRMELPISEAYIYKRIENNWHQIHKPNDK